MTLMLSPTPGISAFPDADGNMLHWTATIIGPKDTPYSDLNLKLSFDFPSNYPYSPPTVLFKTPIYHPNIDLDGNVCLNILREDWKPVLNLNAVVVGLQFLFLEPNASDPLNKEAANDLMADRDRFRRNVRSSMGGGQVKGEAFDRVLLK